MDERRGDQPPPETGAQPPIVAGNARLSPMQKAYGRYTAHTLHCAICRDVDRGRCDTAEELWRVYQTAQHNAFQRLGSEARRT